jgi:hypothetical protein
MMKVYYVSEDGVCFHSEEEARKHGKVYRRLRPGDKGYRYWSEAKPKDKQEPRTVARQSPPETLTDDPTAYRPANEFIDADEFPDFKAIQKALAANPLIRRKRPTGKNGKEIKNRLIIHAGDWHKFRQRQQVNPLDLPAAVVDAVTETENRKAKVRRLKRK